MIPIVNIIKQKTGQKKFKFFELGIYDLLKNQLGFRYTKINNKGYFLRLKENGYFEIVNFLELSESFRDYIKSEFENIQELKGLSFDEFIHEYYDKSPIKKGDYCRDYLSQDFELTADNLHRLLLLIDNKYRERNKVNEMLKFLEREQFIETVDEIGNFSIEKPLYYKRLSPDEFLVFNQSSKNKKTHAICFDFWLVKVDSETQFLQRKLPNKALIDLRKGFDLEKDIEIYNEKK